MTKEEAKAAHQARREWYEREIVPYIPNALRFARAKLINVADAEDVVQDSLLAVLNWVDYGKPLPKHPRGWLLRTVSFKCGNYWDKERGVGRTPRVFVPWTPELEKELTR